MFPPPGCFPVPKEFWPGRAGKHVDGTSSFVSIAASSTCLAFPYLISKERPRSKRWEVGFRLRHLPLVLLVLRSRRVTSPLRRRWRILSTSLGRGQPCPSPRKDQGGSIVSAGRITRGRRRWGPTTIAIVVGRSGRHYFEACTRRRGG